MKLQRGLATRIVLVALAVGAVSAAAGVAGLVTSYRDSLGTWLGDRWRGEYGREMTARCLEDPAAFNLRDDVGLRVQAFDATTGRSANAQTQPEDPAQLVGLNATPTPPAYPRLRFTAFVRGSPRGPCSAMRLTMDQRQTLRTTVLRNTGITVVLVTLAAGLSVLLLVVGPFRRRIAVLRASAASVGGPDYANTQREAPDELGDVARSIHLAHARIREDHEALVASRSALERFLGDVAHDLRTPLTSLRLALEELDDCEIDDDARAVLRAAFDDVVYASSLTENLKLASQLEQDWPTERRSIDLRELADRVAMRESVFARRAGLAFHTSLPDAALTVQADPVLVEQALSNVVQNAIIHGQSGGRVELRLTIEGEGFLFEVLDDGPGVPPEVLPRLGERAFRSDAARARDPKGSGLGLAITTEVCERLGWLLTFERREPRGLRVCIRG